MEVQSSAFSAEGQKVLTYLISELVKRTKARKARASFWSAVASVARRRFGYSRSSRIQCAVAASLCRRTPQPDPGACAPETMLPPDSRAV